MVLFENQLPGTFVTMRRWVINTNAPTSLAQAGMARKAVLKPSVVAIMRLNKLGPMTAPRKLKNTVPPVAFVPIHR